MWILDNVAALLEIGQADYYNADSYLKNRFFFIYLPNFLRVKKLCQLLTIVRKYSKRLAFR